SRGPRRGNAATATLAGVARAGAAPPNASPVDRCRLLRAARPGSQLRGGVHGPAHPAGGPMPRSIWPIAAGLRDASRRVRLAPPGDIPRLRGLIEQSVRALSAPYYTGPQIESALRYVFGPDTQLIADRTYYVIESEAGELVAAGGWSRRRTLYGG